MNNKTETNPNEPTNVGKKAEAEHLGVEQPNRNQNKTISGRDLPGTMPCPICGEVESVRVDKKGHPYMVCDPCGVQLFIRRAAGIENLKCFFSDPDLRNVFLDGSYCKNAKIIRAKIRIRLIEKELNSLDLISFSESENEYKNNLKSKLLKLQREIKREILK